MLRWISALSWNFVLLGLMSVAATALHYNPAHALESGMTCVAGTDTNREPKTLDRADSLYQRLDNYYGSCYSLNEFIGTDTKADQFFQIGLILNSFDTTPNSIGVKNFRIDYHANDISNVTVNGVAYNSSTNILFTSVTVLNVQFESEGKILHFVVTVDPINHTLTGFTVQAGPAPVIAPTGPTESELLAEQQSFFTTLIMNQQSGNLISGVGDNLDSLLNGNDLAPVVSENGFSYQSTGASKWYAKRLKMAHANKQPAAFDIFAYQSNKVTASTKAVEKLNPVASEDIYAADASSEEELIYSPWNAWIKGSWSVFDGKGSSFDGHMVDVVGGVDYRLSDDLIIGVLGGYGVADFDTLSAGTAGKFESDGVHAGVYLGKRLAPNLLLDALVAYTGSDYDNRSGTTTGSFSAQRVTVAAHLKGNVDWEMVTVQPTIGLVYASENQDSYTDSAAVVHASKTVTAGRLSIGPKFIFQPMTTDFGKTQFWFAAKGEYDFSNQNTSTTSSLPNISDFVSARVQGGFSATNESGVSLSLQGDLSGLGSGEYIGYGATAKLSLPF